MLLHVFSWVEIWKVWNLGVTEDWQKVRTPEDWEEKWLLKGLWTNRESVGDDVVMGWAKKKDISVQQRLRGRKGGVETRVERDKSVYDRVQGRELRSLSSSHWWRRHRTEQSSAFHNSSTPPAGSWHLLGLKWCSFTFCFPPSLCSL